MIRRNPTRIELKMEDIQDFKAKKEELDRKNQSSSSKNILGSSLNSSSAVVPDLGTKMSQDTVHYRIGYNPKPKMN